MRFHIDTDLGTEISLWVAPDHPDHTPQISIWDGQSLITTIDANVLREDVRQLGMHSTGQVGFSITSDTVKGIERLKDLKVFAEGDESSKENRLLIYRRANGTLNQGQRLLIFDTGANRENPGWDSILSQYALSYPDLEVFNLETLMSVLGNELAPSIGAIGFPYLSRVRSILNSLDYRIVMMFRDPMYELAHQIDRRIETQDDVSLDIDWTRSAKLNRRALIAILRKFSESETFELSNPVMRKLLKAPGEPVSPKDVTTALRQLTQLDFVATDQTRNVLVKQAKSSPILLPPAPQISERQRQIAEQLLHIGMATDMIAEDLALYDLTSAAITRACEKSLTHRSPEE